MMRLVYPICCGLDVHKNVIAATIVTTNNVGISEYNQKSFSTINSDIQKFHDWLIKNRNPILSSGFHTYLLAIILDKLVVKHLNI